MKGTLVVGQRLNGKNRLVCEQFSCHKRWEREQDAIRATWPELRANLGEVHVGYSNNGAALARARMAKTGVRIHQAALDFIESRVRGDGFLELKRVRTRAGWIEGVILDVKSRWPELKRIPDTTFYSRVAAIRRSLREQYAALLNAPSLPPGSVRDIVEPISAPSLQPATPEAPTTVPDTVPTEPLHNGHLNGHDEGLGLLRLLRVATGVLYQKHETAKLRALWDMVKGEV